MEFPSIRLLLSGTKKSVQRFPWVVVITFIGISVALILTENLKLSKNEEFSRILTQILLCCSLGLPLLLALALFGERNLQNGVQRSLLSLLGVVFLVAFYFTFSERLDFIDASRFGLYLLAFHLSVSFAPYLLQKDLNGFWQFNKTLFLRIIIGGIYSGVLYAGISVALLSINALFNVRIDGEWYLRIFILIAGGFNTIFFLVGVPESYEELESDVSYPKELKVFTQYILLPLVTLYLVILYMYSGKILVEWQLPKGWVSYLVLAFSVSGILSLLLIHPIRELENNQWIKTFSKRFYLAIFPLIILLIVAIGKRILAYGITENRYFIMILAGWLAGISLYFLLSTSKSIKVIPISLAFLAFFSSFGFWGAFSVAKRSQKNEFLSLLEKNKILKDNKIVGNAKGISEKDRLRLTSSIDFFEQRNSLDEINLYWSDSTQKELRVAKSGYDKASILKKSLGVPTDRYYSDVTADNNNDSYKNISFYVDGTNKYISVQGYDKMLMGFYFSEKNEVIVDSLSILMSIEDQNVEITDLRTNKKNQIALGGFVEKIVAAYRVDNQKFDKGVSSEYKTLEELSFPFEDSYFKGKLCFQSIQMSISKDAKDKSKFLSGDFNILVKIKK